MRYAAPAALLATLMVIACPRRAVTVGRRAGGGLHERFAGQSPELQDAGGLTPLRLGDTGYGTGVAIGDIDNDGLVDVYVANYGRDALYRNRGNGSFDNVTKGAGIADYAWTASVAFCDYDSDGFLDADGDFDFLVSNTAGRARLFRNDAPRKGRSLMVCAYDPALERDAHDAVVTVTAAGKSYTRIADPAFSYLVSNEPKAHFGIPGAERADSIRVRWPDGSEEVIPGVALDQTVTLEKGQGRKTEKSGSR